MTTAACCVPTLVPAISALPATLPMPRTLPGVESAGTLRPAGAGPIRLHRPAWSRAWLALLESWSGWRAAARRRAELQALARLDRHVLRDVGLDELAPPRLSPSWQEIERARW
ncbi:MAG: hypothetical protein HZC37_26305 [Burkholderiales bacterium]|nr:hypothetical protein [Burkholderiales bacterium]